MALRSNYPITFVLHNNANYGLTTGQATPLTWQGQPMNTSPNGIPERTLAEHGPHLLARADLRCARLQR